LKLLLVGDVAAFTANGIPDHVPNVYSQSLRRLAFSENFAAVLSCHLVGRYSYSSEADCCRALSLFVGHPCRHLLVYGSHK
jgi:hypothetical protein